MTKSNHPGAFAHRPSPEDMPMAWEIYRVPAGGSPSLLCLDEDTIGAYTHYWSGRTNLCLKSACVPCEKGNHPRWRGYLAVILATNRTTRLLELTPSCVPAIDRYLSEWKTLRGAVLKITRKGRSKNGQLELDIAEKPISSINLPSGPDVVACLLRLWRQTHVPTPDQIRVDELTKARASGLVPGTSRNGRSSVASRESL